MAQFTRVFKFRRLAYICHLLSIRGMSKVEMIGRIEDRFSESVSKSCFEKDLDSLRNDFDAPIEYNYQRKLYEYTKSYNFKEIFFDYLIGMGVCED